MQRGECSEVKNYYYGDNTHVADEYNDTFPVTHPNKLLWHSPSVNVYEFVLVLQNFNRVSQNDQQWGKWEALR
jgi:hypothetical protein